MIRLAPGLREALLSHAQEGVPEEVCGVMGGERSEGDGLPASDVVTETRRVANAADAPRTRYELDPGEQLAAMRDLEGAGLAVVGFYHSHPQGPDGPSPTDERLATWPDHVYVIVSLGGDRPTVSAWRWTGEGFEPERVAEA